MWRRFITVAVPVRGAISSGADWATPGLEPTKFKVDVEFPPPRVFRVACDFQAICIEPVAQDSVPYDQAEVNFQGGPEAEPDCDEDGDVQDQGPVPFGGCDARHVVSADSM